jgi:ATP-dependent helicase/nuclease subunit B
MKFFDESPSATWITANQRLALYWRRTYDQAQQAMEKTVWETLDCLSFKHWILRAYVSLPEAKVVLTESQELTLWESIISRSLVNKQPEWALLSPRGLAKMAQAAWHLLKESTTPLHLLDAYESAEVKAFCQWAKLFSEWCATKNQIDFSGCVDRVSHALAEKKIILPTTIIAAGFAEIPAQIKRVFAALTTQCVLQYQETPNQQSAAAHRVGFENEDIELQAMAQWALKQQLNDPAASIACIVPNLSVKRYTVERLFKQAAVATPAIENVMTATSSVQADLSLQLERQTANPAAKYNISGGFPFSHCPVIQTAFDILKLGVAMLDVETLSRLLRSPFVGGAETELIARASLDLRIKQRQEPYIYWQTMQVLAKQNNCNSWISQCDAYAQHVRTNEQRSSATDWSQYFFQQLQCLGWPGERAISSSEYQQVERWHALLEELALLDVVLEKPVSGAQALQHLYHLAQATLFQPKTADASIQVLGMLEAVGLPFDYIWVSAMTQDSWPARASPNPFIPIALQRSRNMPHASAERELAYSRALTQRFCHSAQHIIFSYALQKEDQPQIPSSLIREIPEIPAKDLYESEPVLIRPQLESFTDEYGPAVSLHEVLHGGASLFKYQAACPFKAFAQIRLGAASMPIATFSMTPSERGICLHDILEQVWRSLGDQQTLAKQDTHALTKLLQPIIKNVLDKVAQRRVFTLKPRFVALEQQRLLAQTLAWLELEKQRPPFKVIALETTQTVQFAGLSLKMRLDREDQLEDGTRLIIDYKTGASSPADWFGDRPDDPQLPLYGLTCEYPIQGLVFAQITADKLQFSGISEKDSDVPGVQSIERQKWDDAHTWNDFLTANRVTLGRIAKSFQTGHAAVDPKKSAQTCRYCNLQSFCRIGN